jgi:hypothetical protein
MKEMFFGESYHVGWLVGLILVSVESNLSAKKFCQFAGSVDQKFFLCIFPFCCSSREVEFFPS